MTEKEKIVLEYLNQARKSVTHMKEMSKKTFDGVCKSLVKKGVVFSDKTEKGFMGYYTLKKEQL